MDEMPTIYLPSCVNHPEVAARTTFLDANGGGWVSLCRPCEEAFTREWNVITGPYVDFPGSVTEHGIKSGPDAVPAENTRALNALFEQIEQGSSPSVPDTDCRVYWGSHGCSLERNHEGEHVCDCCDCPEGHHNGVEAPELVDEEGVVCVARAPYYGPETRFYGEDAE